MTETPVAKIENRSPSRSLFSQIVRTYQPLASSAQFALGSLAFSFPQARMRGETVIWPHRASTTAHKGRPLALAEAWLNLVTAPNKVPTRHARPVRSRHPSRLIGQRPYLNRKLHAALISATLSRTAPDLLSSDGGIRPDRGARASWSANLCVFYVHCGLHPLAGLLQ